MDVYIREDITVDEFIDVLIGNRRYVNCLYVYNKIDTTSMEVSLRLFPFGSCLSATAASVVPCYPSWGANIECRGPKSIGMRVRELMGRTHLDLFWLGGRQDRKTA